MAPSGSEENHDVVVDLVKMKAFRFGDNGENIAEEKIPADMKEQAEEMQALLDAASMVSDDPMEAMLEETVTEELIHAAILGTISRKIFSWVLHTRTRAFRSFWMRLSNIFDPPKWAT